MKLTQTVKVQLLLVNQEQTQEFNDILSRSGELANTVMNELAFEYIVKKRQHDPEQGKFKHGIPMNYSYQATGEFKDIPSVFRLGVSTFVKNKFFNDIKDVERGKITMATFRSNLPMFFTSGATSNAKGFLQEVNQDYLLSIGGFQFITYLGKNNENGRAWIRKIKAGEAKFCDSSLQRKGRKYFLNLAISFEHDNSVVLDADKVCGVDLGIKIPVVVATNYNENRDYIGGENIIKRRWAFKKQRQRLQKELVDSCGGHGRKRKLQALDRLGNAEKNYVKTLFHTYSKQVIDFALKNNCGKIKMEDLSGIGDNIKVLQQNWGYFQLQSMIEYKAKYFGIEIIYVNPRYTSQTCSECGHREKENRKTQAEFKCVECGHEMNADYNAAINISKWTELSKKKNK